MQSQDDSRFEALAISGASANPNRQGIERSRLRLPERKIPRQPNHSQSNGLYLLRAPPCPASFRSRKERQQAHGSLLRVEQERNGPVPPASVAVTPQTSIASYGALTGEKGWASLISGSCHNRAGRNTNREGLPQNTYAVPKALVLCRKPFRAPETTHG